MARDHPPQCHGEQHREQIRHALGRDTDAIERREHQHPQEIAIALHALQAGVEHQAQAVTQIARIAERDVGVVSEESVHPRVHQQHGEREYDAGLHDPSCAKGRFRRRC